MGLLRLFWIPDGATPNDGAYVRYPQDALLAVLRQESARARSLVIGEDLGTVPDGFRDGLSASDVLSYRVLWFEQEGGQFKTPSRYSAKAAACVSTHDLPTIAGWWSGTDIDEKHSLRMLTDDAAALERRERTQSKAALIAALEESGVVGANVLKPSSPHDAGITAAIHGYLCDSASALVLLQADDLAGETAALNLPGTDRGRPNWRRKLRVNVEALWKTRSGRAAGEDFARHHRREGE